MIRFFELGASIRIVACTLRSPTLALVYRGLIFPYLRIYLVEKFLINFYCKLIQSNSTVLVKYLGKIFATVKSIYPDEGNVLGAASDHGGGGRG